MSRLALILLLASGFLPGWLPAPAGAAEPCEGFVSGDALVTVQPLPVAVRMEVQLCSYGRTVALTLERLKARREVALEKLRALQPEEKSIALANPRVSIHGQPRSVPYEPVPSARAPVPSPAPSDHHEDGDRSFRSAEGTLDSLFAASQLLAADWPLRADDQSGLLQAAQQIRQKVGCADVGGRKDPQDLSDEEQELVDETLVVVTPSGPYARIPSGPPDAMPAAALLPEFPHFVFVARLTDQQRKAALGEAFAEAKRQAGELAEAADARLGPLVELNGRVSSGPDGLHGNTASKEFSAGQDGALTLVSDNREATSAEPGALRFTFSLTARFRLQ